MPYIRTLIVFVVGLACAHGASAATPEQVAEAIRKGREFLLSRQANGHWETTPTPTATEAHATEGGQWGGMTALATYALLAAGEPASSPKMQEAIAFLRDAEIRGVYALGMRAQVWELLPKEPWVEQAIGRDVQALLDGVLQSPDNTGLYNYTTPASPNDVRVDHSVSQYGVLGMWALQRAGGNVPVEYWQYVERVWEGHQDPSGGWCYDRIPKDGFPLSMSMTAAGVATLFITLDYLHADEGVQPRGNIMREPIERGLGWMSRNFQHTGEDWYTWYGIERIGVASGRKQFAGNDWYKAGSDLMVSRQQEDGSFPGWRDPSINTSFCLIFLSRGRAPFMMSKLQYEVLGADGKAAEGLWNQRPRDVANVTRWVGRRIERDLNWQSVTLDGPAEELVESPLLYISGSAALNFSDEDKESLRQFVLNGGMLIGNADAGKKQFTDSFKALGESLFPAYEFREVPEKHPIYIGQQFQRSRWRIRPSVLALGNGAREFMIITPVADLSRQWQIMDLRREEQFQLAANIYLYATDKTVQYKGERKVLKIDPAVTTGKTITVARLEYEGNWDPEPAGWERLRAHMHNARQVELKVEKVKLGDGALAEYGVAHLTGTGACVLSEEERAELKRFVEAGGTLIVDAAGGDSEFRTSVENELVQTFGADTAKSFRNTLNPDSALYVALGEAATKVEYRTYARHEVQKATSALLRGHEVEGKYRVIYSPQDLSVGLMGQPVDGIAGYTPQSATELMAALLNYASAD